MQSMKVLRNPTLWGAGALVIVVVGALVVAGAAVVGESCN